MRDSSQTAEARAAARDDRRRWNEHARMCAQCARTKHKGRRASAPCPRGRRLLELMADSAELLGQQIELDHQPNPAQLPLFEGKK